MYTVSGGLCRSTIHSRDVAHNEQRRGMCTVIPIDRLSITALFFSPFPDPFSLLALAGLARSRQDQLTIYTFLPCGCLCIEQDCCITLSGKAMKQDAIVTSSAIVPQLPYLFSNRARETFVVSIGCVCQCPISICV